MVGVPEPAYIPSDISLLQARHRRGPAVAELLPAQVVARPHELRAHGHLPPAQHDGDARRGVVRRPLGCAESVHERYDSASAAPALGAVV